MSLPTFQDAANAVRDGWFKVLGGLDGWPFGPTTFTPPDVGATFQLVVVPKDPATPVPVGARIHMDIFIDPGDGSDALTDANAGVPVVGVLVDDFFVTDATTGATKQSITSLSGLVLNTATVYDAYFFPEYAAGPGPPTKVVWTGAQIKAGVTASVIVDSAAFSPPATGG